MEKHRIRDEFVSAFTSLVIDHGSRDISVVDLTRCVGCSRKTFYRYFDDLDDLVIWKYRAAMLEVLRNQVPGAIWVAPDTSLCDKYPDVPFYARIIMPDGSLDESLYMYGSACHFENNAEYYCVLFNDPCVKYRDFRRYLRNLYVPAIRGDIEAMLRGGIVPSGHIQFLCEYHACALVARLNQFICEEHGMMSKEDELHWNYTHQAIYRDLETYFSQAHSVKPLDGGPADPAQRIARMF